MQVLPTISALLAGLIILLSLHAVDSLSISRRSEPQLFTLPLQRIPERTDIHPQMLLQLRINRGIRRLAKMTGAEPPSDHSLKQRLERRMLSLDLPSGIDRRFNRIGVHNEGDVELEKRFNQVGVSKRNATDVTIAEAPTALDSLGLDIEGQDVGYLATVQIGTPPRDALILVDSGSADFWVGSEDCNTEGQTNTGCGNHNFLGPNSSSSFADLSKNFSVTYGTGGVNGSLISDVVTIAGLTLLNHTFGVANQETTDFTGSPFDGLMGLALSKHLSEQQTPTPIEALKDANKVTSATVSYDLGRIGDKNNTGEITFGGEDPTKFKSNTRIKTPNVNLQGFWEAALDAVEVDGNTVEKIINRTTILDTGTTLMLLPEEDVILIHAQIPGALSDGQGGFVIPCANTAVVTLTYGGQKFPIDPRDLVVGNSVDVSGGTPGTHCASGIVTSNAFSKNEWLVGDVFLKNAYFSTNVDENAISLAIPSSNV